LERDIIDHSILRYLAEQEWPVTTEMVARKVKVSWNTAQIHLYKLMSEGLVRGKKVGRQNQWVISKKERLEPSESKQKSN